MCCCSYNRQYCLEVSAIEPVIGTRDWESLWSHASSHTNGPWTGRVDCWGRPCTDLSGLSLKQRYQVPTASGPISVVVCGDQDKPALLTYPDVGLNCKNLHPYPNSCSLTLWPSELGFFSSHHGSLLDFMMHHERLLHCWKRVLSDWRFGCQEGLQISSFLFWNVECSLMHELRCCLAHRESSMYSESHFFVLFHLQMYHVLKGCFHILRPHRCFTTIFAYTMLMHWGMRSVSYSFWWLLQLLGTEF